jgi:hypothetical protein
MPRAPQCLDNQLKDGGEFVNLTRRSRFKLGKILSIRDRSAIGINRSTEKSSDLVGNWTHELPAYNIVTRPSIRNHMPRTHLRVRCNKPALHDTQVWHPLCNFLHSQVTSSMQQSLNQKLTDSPLYFNYRDHKIPPLDPILCQHNPVYT